jgi:NDP-sugar pyrophosphorylase family protein
MMQRFKLNELEGWIVPAGTLIDPWSTIPEYSEIGDSCTIGNNCTIGYRCKFGDDCIFWDECTLGNGCVIGFGCVFGKECMIEGLIAKRFLTLGNIDGSGHQILIVSDGETTKVRAGCFVGNLDEFVERSKSENKMKYARIIPAVVTAMLDEGE